jgi:hypothetical protein
VAEAIRLAVRVDIDSSWLGNVPVLARAGRHFDRCLVTEEENVDAWQHLTHAPATWLP